MIYRVWPCRTVQCDAEHNEPYSFMSDDFVVVDAESEEEAIDKVFYRKDKTMSKNKAYEEMVVEPWEVILANFNPSAVRGYFIGETLAYLMRYNGLNNDERGSTKDLMKAKHFIERLIDYDNGLHLSGNEDRSRPGAVRGAWEELQAMPYGD